MKMKTLAIAIALGAMPFAAQADLKISGDFGVGYFGDATGNNEMEEYGSEINFDATEKVGGTTFYGHTELDINGSGNTARFEEVRVGAKGAWGDLTLGDIGNACDQLMVGGFPDKFMAPSTQGGCSNPGNDVISYKRSMGAATVGVTHSPDANEHNSIAVAGAFGPVGAALAVEDGDEVGGTNIVLGLTGKIGPLAVGLRANSFDSDTAGGDMDAIGINAKYTVGANSYYAGMGKGDPATGSDVDSWTVGYNRSIGSNSTFVFEAGETDGDAETSYGVGLIHAF